jgi:predicted nucleic acid-binding protein
VIFVDSSFWIAFAMTRDDHHDEAIDLLRRHASDRLVTTTHVRGEAWTFLRRRLGSDAGRVMLMDLAASARLTIVHPGDQLERDALDWMATRGERPYSHVDAVIFAVMRAEGIRRALAFDDDFAVAGFEVLRA